MTLEELKTVFANDDRTAAIASALKEDGCRIRLQGLCGSAPAFSIASAVEAHQGVHLVVVDDKESAAYFMNDLQSLLGTDKTVFFPRSYRHAYESERTDNANIQQRAEVLNTVGRRKNALVIVSYPEALSEKVVTRQHLKQNTLGIKRGDQLSIEFLNEVLQEYGFERVDYVYEPGQFAIRGGIVDVFSFSNDMPFRIELFGDDVDSIREFDPASQLSQRSMQRVTVVPNVQERLLRESREPFMQFLPEKTTVWFKDLTLSADKLDEEFKKAEKAFAALDSTVTRLGPGELYTRKIDLLQQLEKHPVVEFGAKSLKSPTAVFEYGQSPQPSFNKNFDVLIDNLQKNAKAGFTNLIASDQPKQLERLYTIFEDIGAEIEFTPINVNFHEGFIDSDLKVAVYTDHQIFERYHRFRLKEGFRKNKQALTIKELNNLQPGDFVTHIDHGVGTYSGLEKIDVNGKEQEAIRLKYKDGDILYVSIHSLHRIAKFTGKEGHQPKMNKLGSQAWQTLKKKTKKKVKEIAFDLIKLYAKRKKQKGFAFAPDSYLQNELEASFMYQDTPDQEKATGLVKQEMEAVTPMDLLVCGDVGFGKTEIAIRAAFKAATDSKQVAVLAPTTVLTFQHYQTFKARLRDFPVTVDYINRFKSTKQQKETLKKVKEGKVDILIGTHRIVGKDVEFKDLGLLVIDEEQKFGVGVKDKLKTMKVNVDTLTLTATPIPRTLQFSLMKARDLSVINTPPPNRYPVQTEVVQFNEELIRDAIAYELSRRGQVFFVHNRVQNIEEVAGMISRLVPDARVAIGHGQMDGKKLEDVMMAFMDGEYDVLVSTTIIESGLDISNANTIMINKAHNFGLSDLHQMRGRVGRSNKKAFCYLMCPPKSHLTSEARRRLDAIEQFSDLGSGFNIAMRDLDIRGAGNLLGAEQTGFISDIGFEMYQKILDEALRELKDEQFSELFADDEEHTFVADCALDTDLEILIPDAYISEITERLVVYKDLSNVPDEAGLQVFEGNLRDRFGAVPQATKALFDAIRLQWLGRTIGFEKILLKQGKLIGYFLKNQDSAYFQSAAFSAVLEWMKYHPAEARMRQKADKLSLVFEDQNSIQQALKTLRKLLPKEAVEVS